MNTAQVKTLLTVLRQQLAFNKEVLAKVGLASPGNNVFWFVKDMEKAIKGLDASFGGQPPPKAESKTKPKMVPPEGITVDFLKLKELRVLLRMNQADFWATFGVAQPTGSRYEAGRWPPMSVRMLITLFVNKVISEDDLAKAWTDSLILGSDDDEE